LLGHYGINMAGAFVSLGWSCYKTRAMQYNFLRIFNALNGSMGVVSARKHESLI